MRNHRRRLNWGRLGGVAFSLAVWAAAILAGLWWWLR